MEQWIGTQYADLLDTVMIAMDPPARKHLSAWTVRKIEKGLGAEKNRQVICISLLSERDAA